MYTDIVIERCHFAGSKRQDGAAPTASAQPANTQSTDDDSLPF